MSTKLANALRMLCIDTVEHARSGHLGMPLGMADVATVLFRDFLFFNPNDPVFEGRDKFVLSGGHGSALLYSLLYLTGYKNWTITDLKSFRRLEAKAAGHPEYSPENGIEISTGPLGQGIANAVGMAISAKKLALHAPELAHNIYVFGGDGDFMEGISHEALSLAGTLNLNNLIFFYDDNNITIDGTADLSCRDDKKKRFDAYNFFVQEIDGHDTNAIHFAISNAIFSNKPSVIFCKTKIGYGIPGFEGTSAIHGKIPPKETIAELRRRHNWTPFEVPEDILAEWRSTWNKNIDRYEACKKINIPSFTSNIDTFLNKIKEFTETHDLSNVATKKIFNQIISSAQNDFLIGGSADLSDSNGTKASWMKDIHAQDFSGSYINYGIREHAMAAIANGINSGGIYYAYTGTFLSFSDYMRPSIRMAALMNIPSMFVFSHDSIFIGEDGPTHQPIEQLDSLHLIPNLYVFRPYNIEEVLASLQYIFESRKPSSLILTRQNVKNLSKKKIENINDGWYAIKEFEQNTLPKLTIVGSGSEVELCFNIANQLSEKFNTQIISVPCAKLLQESQALKNILCTEKNTPVVVIEASTAMFLSNLIPAQNKLVINIQEFGRSAPQADLRDFFGFTENKIIEKIEKCFT